MREEPAVPTLSCVEARLRALGTLLPDDVLLDHLDGCDACRLHLAARTCD